MKEYLVSVFFDESGNIAIVGKGEYYESAYPDYGIVTDIDAANSILKALNDRGMFLCGREVESYIIQNYSVIF